MNSRCFVCSSCDIYLSLILRRHVCLDFFKLSSHPGKPPERGFDPACRAILNLFLRTTTCDFRRKKKTNSIWNLRAKHAQIMTKWLYYKTSVESRLKLDFYQKEIKEEYESFPLCWWTMTIEMLREKNYQVVTLWEKQKPRDSCNITRNISQEWGRKHEEGQLFSHFVRRGKKIEILFYENIQYENFIYEM